jgi:hypothetical protein
MRLKLQMTSSETRVSDSEPEFTVPGSMNLAPSSLTFCGDFATPLTDTKSFLGES